jgi:Undecaprenyl-phosphate galactose phosphotransferase, WbaP/exopolysaccharide biosynthesis polyprenyl glycosylphosphotransferase
MISDLLSLFMAFYVSDKLMMLRVSHVLEALPLKEQDFSRFTLFVLVVFIGVCSFLYKQGHYTYRKPFWTELKEVVNVIVFMSMLDLLILSLSKWSYSRWHWLVLWILVMVFLPTFRQLIKKSLEVLKLRQWSCVIVGCNSNARDAYFALNDEKNMCFNVIGFVSASGDEEVSPINGVPCLTLSIDELKLLYPGLYFFIALDYEDKNKIQKWLRDLSLHHISNVAVVPTLRGIPLYGTEIYHLFSREMLILIIKNNLSLYSSRFVKRTFDIFLSLFFLIVLSPLLFFLCVLLFRDCGSPFYSHVRVGRAGKQFSCYKFRTMSLNSQTLLQDLLAKDPIARAEWERDFKLKHDPRITKIGRFLRRSSLDELPQLWNVLIGDMSLVGPRPVIDIELPRYGDDAEFYLMTRPGLTGLWQVSGRNNTDYSNRVYLDSWYVKNWSLWYDIAILFKTINVVLKRDGAY